MFVVAMCAAGGSNVVRTIVENNAIGQENARVLAKHASKLVEKLRKSVATLARNSVMPLLPVVRTKHARTRFSSLATAST